MTPKQIDTAIAEVTGKNLPYSSDLNATHGAEKTLDNSGRLRFGEQLHAVLKLGYELDDDTQLSGWSVFETAHATAAQRAEAFLRTLGKWPVSPQDMR